MRLEQLQEHGWFTLPWTSYLIEPSSSAPNSISFEIVVLISVTVNDSNEEYPFSFTTWSLHQDIDLILLSNDRTHKIIHKGKKFSLRQMIEYLICINQYLNQYLGDCIRASLRGPDWSSAQRKVTTLTEKSRPCA